MGKLGQFLGAKVGSIFGSRINDDNKERDWKSTGQTIGSFLGQHLTKYHKGGRVKKTGLAVLKANEFVLPPSVKPTKQQKAVVKKLHKFI